MSLKVIHINLPDPRQKDIEALAQRLKEKWEKRDREEAKKMFPNYKPEEDDKLNPTA